MLANINYRSVITLAQNISRPVDELVMSPFFTVAETPFMNPKSD